MYKNTYTRLIKVLIIFLSFNLKWNFIISVEFRV